MAKTDAFLNIGRRNFQKQSPAKRVTHYQEFYQPMAVSEVRDQARRCMDCGVPFCHGYGCPLGNLIPDWNEMVAQGRWRDASDLLHLTNNFPEITGRVCPALCEAACTLGVGDDPVTVRQNELSIVERAFRERWIRPQPPARETGKKVAVVGSGPAGLAAAQQLRRAGHHVLVYERSDQLGGILRYAIPDFKLEKRFIDRRLHQMTAEGVIFETNVAVGSDISAGYLLKAFDAVCLCIGTRVPRDLPLPGRDLEGIHFAIPYLSQQNRRVAGLPIADPPISADGKRVVIIGGGDTGADCLGTALRQGAASVHQFEILPKPPAQRDPSTPWPTWPHMLRSSPAHDEGGERRWSVATDEFLGAEGKVTGLVAHEVEWVTPAEGGRPQMRDVAGSEFQQPADLVLLAMGKAGSISEVSPIR